MHHGPKKDQLIITCTHDTKNMRHLQILGKHIDYIGRDVSITLCYEEQKFEEKRNTYCASTIMTKDLEHGFQDGRKGREPHQVG